MIEQHRNEIAAFRFGLIAAVVQRNLHPGQRYALLREIASQSYTIPGSEKTKVSVRSLERYLQAYEAGGFEALKPKERTKGGSLKHTDPALLKRALELRKELATRSVEQIIRILELEELAPPGKLRPRTVSRFFEEQGWSPKDVRREVKKAFQQFEHDAANDCWQADTNHWGYIPDPRDPSKKKKVYLIAIIDDHSRRITHAEFFFEERYPRLEYCVQKAVLKYGVPHVFFVDNGSVYSAKQFNVICARMGTKLIHAKPYSPESKGKIEKWFRYVDSSFTGEAHILLGQGKLTTLAQLNTYFHSWVDAYNNRVHRTTKQTPKQRFEASGDSIRHMKAEELQSLFLWEEERTVRKTSVIEIEGNSYDVDTSLKGKKIQVHYNPYDLSVIQVWKDDVRYADAKPAQLSSQRHSKLPADPEETVTTVASNYLERLKAQQEATKRKALGTTSFAKLKEKTMRGEANC